MSKKCNAVFEGGGVRGIGHVGAVCRMEQAGWQFEDTAGSSAGAIIAALLAAGYTGEELKKELASLKGLFSGKRRKELEEQLEELESALEAYKT